ncbi:MAG: glycosyltransferase family 4 protein [Muribaculaceae bacterium]|nr:glycosyltransferase family 4 protein [Muribaculaceae bacterium]
MGKKIRVAFLDYSPVFAGAERILHNMIANIDRDKYEPILLFRYPQAHQERYNDLNCKKIYLAHKPAWWMGSDYWRKPVRGSDKLKRLEFGRRIAKIINKEGIQILDINLMRVDVGDWVLPVRLLTKAKIIGHYRSQSQQWVAPARAQKLLDCVACVSEFSKMRFQLKGKFVKAEVLYDSIEPALFKSSLSQAEAKAKLGYPSDTKLLVSVGQLSLHKGHDTAIRVMAGIADKWPEARLLVVGGGGLGADYYRQLAAELGVSDRVVVPGVQIGNIQDIYKAADLTFSLTKVGEGFGLVPYESACAGTPFIAPEFGAIIEFVEDMKSGLLVDTNNLDAVVAKTEWALSHPDELKEMVTRLQDTISKKLVPEVLAENLDKIYTALGVRNAQ